MTVYKQRILVSKNKEKIAVKVTNNFGEELDSKILSLKGIIQKENEDFLNIEFKPLNATHYESQFSSLNITKSGDYDLKLSLNTKNGSYQVII